MKEKSINIYSTLFILFLITPVSAIASDSNVRIDEIRQDMKQTLSQLEENIGTAECQTTAQCKSVAIGQKACGGPRHYLAYSTTESNESNINMLAKKHRNLNKLLNKLTGAMSDCMMVSPPILLCENNKCVAK